jgi:glucosamine--fructose-6-phosphate aminotransferase (isomerizing)
MDTRGRYTREEINSQPESWVAAHEVLITNQNRIVEISHSAENQQVIFTGCGSTYYLASAVAVLFQEMTGITAKGLPASELWLYPKSSYISRGETLLIAISRSGETSETIQACEAFNQKQSGRIITFVCYPGSTLNKTGVLNLVFPSGREKSIAQTRAFSTLFLSVTGLCAIWSNQVEKLNQIHRLSTAGRAILENYRSMAEHFGKKLDIDRIYYLGSGPRYGLACELNLKMKEMTLTHSEAFHFLEFRHGPKAMVNEHTLVIGLVSEMNAERETRVLAECKTLGAEIISIRENNMDVTFNSGVEEVMRNILYLPFCQMLAYERSMAKSLDPDRPNNLDSVVILSK